MYVTFIVRFCEFLTFVSRDGPRECTTCFPPRAESRAGLKQQIGKYLFVKVTSRESQNNQLFDSDYGY